MYVNKVVYAGRVLIDLTDSTVTPETLAEGVVAYNAAGQRIIGTAKASSDGYAALIDSNGLSFVDADGNTFAIKEE